MIILDTSAIFAYFNAADSNHDQAEALIDPLIDSGLLLTIHNLVLIELCTLNSVRGLNNKALTNFTQDVAAGKLAMFTLQQQSPQQFRQVLSLMPNFSRYKLSFVDVSLLHLKQQSPANKLLTFDKQLAKLAK